MTGRQPPFESPWLRPSTPEEQVSEGESIVTLTVSAEDHAVILAALIDAANNLTGLQVHERQKAAELAVRLVVEWKAMA